MKTQAKLTLTTVSAAPQALRASMAPAARLRTTTVTVLLLLGWATRQPVNAAHTLVPQVARPVPLELETIAVMAPDSPARFSFDRAKGKVEYAGDAAGDAARGFLDPPRDGEPALNAILASAGTVVAPFAATYAAISAGRRKLSPEQLSGCETSLVRAMALMADQEHLRDLFLKAAREKVRRHLVLVDAPAGPPACTNLVTATVETRVEELRLERTGSSDASYVLLVKARARLVRAADGATLFDQPFRHRSGKGLFLDWTLQGVFQKLAENAYRELAGQMVAQLFASPVDGPMLVGDGYKRSTGPPSRYPGLLAASRLQSQAFARFVDYPAGIEGSVGIFSSERPVRVTIQMPLTKADAVSEAAREVDWSLDGLQDSHNPVISLGACAVAVPVSLWKQTAGAFLGLSQKQYQVAVTQLSAAARQARPQEEVAAQVALQLAPRTSQSVMLAKTPWPQGHTAGAAADARAMLIRSGQAPLPRGDLRGQIPDTALQVQVLRASLRGKEGVNPRLALCVESEVTLWRVNDGRALGSFPVHYRSVERKFVDWAAHDARRLRQELEQCYRELGRTMVDQIAPPGLRTPDGARSPLLAEK